MGVTKMSSFTTPPIVKLHITDNEDFIELFVPFTYYREPILKADGTVKQPHEYTVDEKRNRSIERITVPAGFMSDGASVPTGFTWIFPRVHGRYAKAAILHDYLYKNAIGSKEEADKIFYEALRVLGCGKVVSKLFYWGAKLIGRGSY